MKRNIKSLSLAALVLFATLAGSAALVGSAAAANTATATDDDSFLETLPANETFAVDNDTEELRAIVENTNGTLDVTVYNATGDTRTEVATGTVTADGADATDTYSFTAIDAANVSEYELEVTGDGAERVQIEMVGVVSGGGGFMDSGYSLAAIVVAVGAIGGLGLYVRSERR